MTKVYVFKKSTNTYWKADEFGCVVEEEAVDITEAGKFDRNTVDFLWGETDKYELIPVDLAIGGSGPAGPVPEARLDASQQRTVDQTVGKKFDAGKPPVYRGFEAYFPNAVIGVSLVSEYGDRKYVPETAPADAHYSDNWAKVEPATRYRDAEGRHRLYAAMGHDYDEESGLAHLQQKAWNAMADLERAVRDGKIELRYGNQIDANGKPIPGTYRSFSI